MKRFNLSLAAALVCTAFGAGAFAQDKVTPGKTGAQQQQADPSNETMDANAQRAHDRNTGSTPRSSTKPQKPQTVARDVRDWKAIDTNHDNLISPEEMEASLKPAPQAAKDVKP